MNRESHIIYGVAKENQFFHMITESVRDQGEMRRGSEVQTRTYRFRIYLDNAQIHILESSLNLP
ncbi:MAG: hypothetical protein ACYDAP_13860 [Thermoplasmataceae archaeon]